MAASSSGATPGLIANVIDGDAAVGGGGGVGVVGPDAVGAFDVEAPAQPMTEAANTATPINFMDPIFAADGMCATAAQPRQF